jgi:hypothetical protein
MKKNFIAVSMAVLLSSAALAETWLPLDTYVRLCVLIVKCKTEVKDEKVQYKVDDVWKGKYSPDMFYHRPPDGYLYTSTWHGNDKPTDGREVIFFFTNDNHPSWTKGKILDHSTSFVVSDGKVVYASTADDDLRKEYSVVEFKNAILAVVDAQTKTNAEP